MVRWASWVAAGLLGLVFVFQVALVLGAPWGDFTQGGVVSGTLPPVVRALAALSAVIVVVFWLGISGRAGWGPWKRRHTASGVVTWIAFGYSVVGLVMNAASQSGSERAVWVPVIGVLLVCSLTVALGTRGSGRHDVAD